MVGDSFSISEATVSRIVKHVSECIADLRKHFITFPTGPAVARVQRQFKALWQIPGIVGAIDCNPCAYSVSRRRQCWIIQKQKIVFFSMNVQALCDADYNFTNVYRAGQCQLVTAKYLITAQWEPSLKPGHIVVFWLATLAISTSSPLWQPNTRAEQRYSIYLTHARVRIITENLFGICIKSGELQSLIFHVERGKLFKILETA